MACILSPKARKIAGGIFLFLVILFMASIFYAWYHMHDRHDGYWLNLDLPATRVAAQYPMTRFEAGAAAVPITPRIADTWVDVDSNAKYQPQKGDRFVDKNGNGTFDAYWLAGFSQARAANGVHDDLWARAVVFGNQTMHVAVVVIDAIGFMMDDVIDVRQMVPKSWEIDHVIVVSTHDHEAPDLLGLWGEKPTHTGVNPAYRQFVENQILKSIGRARENLQPATVRMIRLPNFTNGLRDSRPPFVTDPDVYVLQFLTLMTREPIATVVNWANHPETLGSENLLITSDFPHYVRQGIEKGLVYDGHLRRKGIGGVAIYLNGAIGGLMTPLHVAAHDPILNQDFSSPSFEKARAIGYALANRVLDAVQSDQWVENLNPRIHLWVKSIRLPFQNKYFRLGSLLGVIDRGMTGWMKLRSEIDLLVLGDAWILTIPGEIYPEIVNGGVVNPPGADYKMSPFEVPPIRTLMEGKFHLIWGLANDEIGYIIPKSEWDEKPPYLYNRKKRLYGEINSLGPATAPELYTAIRHLLQ